MKLETERLILREFTIDDLEAFALLMSDPEVMRFSITGPMTDREQVRNYLQKRILDHYAKYGYGVYAAIQKKDNCLVGCVGLINQNIDGESKTELGYRFHPNYWNQGLATEAALAICQYTFDRLGIDEFISIIESQNKRSLELAKRIGMYYWKDAVFHNFPVGIYVLKKLTLKPFQQNWTDDFEKEKERLLNAFKDLSIKLFHIGSTAIPHCNAKPIIDILGVTWDITQVDQYAEALSKLGYQAMGEYGMKQRRFFIRKHQDPVHLHIFEDSDPEVERHLRFVAYLKAHTEIAEEYAQIKQELVRKFSGNINQYSLGKEKFIKKIDIMAAQSALKPIHAKKDVSRKRSWSPSEILKAMEVNMHLQMTYFAKYVDTVELVFQPDVTVVRSDIKDDTYNYILSARFKNSNVDDRVAKVIKIFEQSSLPYSWWVGPLDTPEILSDVLLSHGLVFKEENIGMYLYLDDFIPLEQKHGLIFQKINSLSQLKDFAQVIVNIGGNSAAFDKIYSKIPLILYQDDTCFEMHLGYLNGIPIVTGNLVLHANVGGIYYVATIPDQRKKGYGKAMVEYLIQRAKKRGYHLATLQASQEGKGLYQRIGFKECCIFKEYSGNKR
jgi:GrpB-like predicted nucleotidyltransferase (UPF0157 family)/GNAT superfamily N-acetyltransferase